MSKLLALLLALLPLNAHASFMVQAPGAGGAACDNGIPTIYAIGTPASGTGTPTPGVPSGTATGDLLVMFCETNTASTCSSSGWTSAGYSDSGSGTNNSRLTILYKLAESSTPARTLNDAGNHAYGHIIGIDGETVSATTPIAHFTAEDRTSAGTAISIAGITTTANGCLILAGSSDGVDGINADGQCDISGTSNGTLGSVTERIENRRGNGDGGTICVGSGTQAAAGATGTWAYNHTGSSIGGEVTIAVCGCP